MRDSKFEIKKVIINYHIVCARYTNKPAGQRQIIMKKVVRYDGYYSFTRKGINYVVLSTANAVRVQEIRDIYDITFEDDDDDGEMRAIETFLEGDPDRLYMPSVLGSWQIPFICVDCGNIKYLVYADYFNANACEEFTEQTIKKGIELMSKFIVFLDDDTSTDYVHFDNSLYLHNSMCEDGINSIWYRGGRGYSFTVWYEKNIKIKKQTIEHEYGQLYPSYIGVKNRFSELANIKDKEKKNEYIIALMNDIVKKSAYGRVTYLFETFRMFLKDYKSNK